MAIVTKAQAHVGSKGYPIEAGTMIESEDFRLTKEMVLKATLQAISPDSTYIHDQVMKMHRAHVLGGGRGYPPRSSLVLARLNALAADGLVKKSQFTNGYYGYRWTITLAGHAALQATHD